MEPLSYYLTLDQDEALVEMEMPHEGIGKTRMGLQLHRKKDLTMLAIKGEGKGGPSARPDTSLQKGDVLVVGGPKKELDRPDLSDV